jgi:hypothetical protein
MAITLGDHFMNLALTEFDHLARRVESTLRAPSVLADEKPVAVFPRVDELRDVLIPLLDWCVGRRPSAARGIVGIAAPCGAGKTLLLSWLAATARGLGLTQFAFAAQGLTPRVTSYRFGCSKVRRRRLMWTLSSLTCGR